MRKHYLLWLGVLVLVVGAIVTSLVLLVYHEPTFYQRALASTSPDPKVSSMLLLTQLYTMAEHFTDRHVPTKQEREKGWSFEFTEEQINSYFDDGFKKWGDAEVLARRGISEPRLSLEGDRIRLAFRYGTMPWSTVISLDLRMWVVKGEINVMALEILNRRAGALPISAQFFLDQVTEIARKSNIDVTWYRHNGNPVALLRFQSDRIRPAAQLRYIEVRPGRIIIGGSPVESAPIALRQLPLPTFRMVRKNQEPAVAGLNPGVQVHTSIYPRELLPEPR